MQKRRRRHKQKHKIVNMQTCVNDYNLKNKHNISAVTVKLYSKSICCIFVLEKGAECRVLQQKTGSWRFGVQLTHSAPQLMERRGGGCDQSSNMNECVLHSLLHTCSEQVHSTVQLHTIILCGSIWRHLIHTNLSKITPPSFLHFVCLYTKFYLFQPADIMTKHILFCPLCCLFQ